MSHKNSPDAPNHSNSRQKLILVMVLGLLVILATVSTGFKTDMVQLTYISTLS